MGLNFDEALAMTSIAGEYTSAYCSNISISFLTSTYLYILVDTSNEGLISYPEFKDICKRIDRHAADEARQEGRVKEQASVKNSELRGFSSNSFRDRESF